MCDGCHAHGSHGTYMLPMLLLLLALPLLMLLLLPTSAAAAAGGAADAPAVLLWLLPLPPAALPLPPLLLQLLRGTYVCDMESDGMDIALCTSRFNDHHGCHEHGSHHTCNGCRCTHMTIFTITNIVASIPQCRVSRIKMAVSVIFWPWFAACAQQATAGR